jgi:hypothetical protein
MRTCVEDHPECLRTISGDTVDELEDPELPSRVLDVGSGDFRSHLRLFESHGRCGQYVALSHCWGTLENWPLRTTRESKQEHLENIPFGRLPKTFQDAVKITRTLGIPYLWIDSLCIIQDDVSDWLCESPKMGQIYKRSRLTVAASGARDSSDGWFLKRAPFPRHLELPYYHNTGEKNGHVVVSLADRKRTTFFWEDLPLTKRAWTT